jgi:hypothetical protein
MSTKATDAALTGGSEGRPGRYIRRSRDEVVRLAEGHRSFSSQEWRRKAPPATPEELAETEEFLRQRELEREAGIAAEVGLKGAASAAPKTEISRSRPDA